MSRENTAEQVQQQYVEAMGPELGNLFFRLWNECVLLHWKWEEFVALFGTNPERIALLNEAAGAFFRIVQDTLWENVLLHISRLTDPSETMGKSNLSLQRLPALVVPEIRTQVTDLLQTCLDGSKFARDWRNRHLAHSDLGLALEDKNAQPLTPASRKEVKDALAAIAALLNAVEKRYKGFNRHVRAPPPWKCGVAPVCAARWASSREGPARAAQIRDLHTGRYWSSAGDLNPKFRRQD